MRLIASGILPESVLYTHTPGPGADTVSFYPLFLGEYYCNKQYRVSRKNYDSFLLIYVKAGRGYAKTPTHSYSLSEGDVLLLDCYIPHSYGTDSGWDIQWIHFDGPMARAYFNRICADGQQIRIANHYPAMHNLRKLLSLYDTGKGVSEVQLARLITDLLTDLMLYITPDGEITGQAGVIDECIRYISENLDREITVEQLAQKAMLSPFYFSRLFKQQTGFTPHHYVTMVRLNFSCYILRTTDLTVKQTGYRCGFNSESNFCTRFRQRFGMTPHEYRITQKNLQD